MTYIMDPPATSISSPDYTNIRIYRADRDRLAARMRYGETMADAIHALIEQARDDAEGE
jgi:hypothetical protein